MKKKKILVIVDMQNDFVTGSLANKEAENVVPRIVEKLQKHGKEYSSILVTLDTHNKNYLGTFEGKNLPVEHCVKGTEGHKIVQDIFDVLQQLKKDKVFVKMFQKGTFVSNKLATYLSVTTDNNCEIEIIGVCTDICVVSNALSIRATLPSTVISVDASCCAGTSVKAHEAALKVMNSCQVKITNRRNRNKNNGSDKKETVTSTEE